MTIPVNGIRAFVCDRARPEVHSLDLSQEEGMAQPSSQDCDFLALNQAYWFMKL